MDAAPHTSDSLQPTEQDSPNIKVTDGRSTAGGARKITFERPVLYPKQLAAIYDTAQYSVIEASTKSGKTWGCIVWILEKAMGLKKGRNCWWVAPVYTQSKIAYLRLKNALPRTIATFNETELTITLANGVTIYFKSGEKSDNLYGDDVYAMVVDEASRLREESWDALLSTITATGAQVRVIGNVKGRKNWFYRLARRAEAGEKGTAYHKITVRDAIESKVLSAENVSAARSKMTAVAAKQLFDVEAADDGDNPFGIEAIDSCVAPMSGMTPVCWGWDLARKQDWTVGVSLDAEGCVSSFKRFQKPWKDTTDEIVKTSGRAHTLVDSTGVGDAILDQLQRAPNGNYEGYVFTTRSKQQLMDELALAIQSRRMRFPDGVIANELKSFEFVFTRTATIYGAPEGLHDDCVCALALAWHVFQSGYAAPAVFETVSHGSSYRENHEPGVLV